MVESKRGGNEEFGDPTGSDVLARHPIRGRYYSRVEEWACFAQGGGGQCFCEYQRDYITQQGCIGTKKCRKWFERVESEAPREEGASWKHFCTHVRVQVALPLPKCNTVTPAGQSVH